MFRISRRSSLATLAVLTGLLGAAAPAGAAPAPFLVDGPYSAKPASGFVVDGPFTARPTGVATDGIGA